MSGNFHTSEYTEETNKMINCKIKSTLRKIHKLKRENLVLSDHRRGKVSEVFIKSQSNGWFVVISILTL